MSSLVPCMYKQVILVRQDLKLPKGKLSVQVAHASVAALEKASHTIIHLWKQEGMKKVVLKIKDEKELMDFVKKVSAAELPFAIIQDAGKTVVEPGTITCLGIGPDTEGHIDRITGHLTMM
jgi:peptidyl-tRNA hydrolase, PTH2 family